MDERLKQALITRPETREQIATWLKVFLGWKYVLDGVRCTHGADGEPGHTSQLDYIYEAFHCKYSGGVFIACRYGGKSYAAAGVDVLDAWFNPGIKIAVAAYKRDQSDFIYTYICDFLQVLESRLESKPWKVKKDEIVFDNGSRIDFFSGGASKAGVKGWHGERLQVDEADLFTMDQFDGIANSLSASGIYPTRLDVLSTNYKVSGEGVILKQIERYEDFNRKNTNPNLRPCRVFRMCLLDILEKCDDRYKCDGCSLWKYCKGVAKTGEGIYRVEKAMETLRDSSTQTFESQMLLLRPSSQYAFFHNFDLVKNICDPNRPLDPTMLTFSIWDWGGASNPHVCLIAQKSDDGVYYIVDELTQMGPLETLIERVFKLYPNATDFDCFADPKGKSKDQVRGSRSPMEVLRSYGFFPRAKLLKRDATAEILYNLIDPADGKVRFKVNKKCVNLLKQIYAAECVLSRGGKPTNQLLDTKVDDCLDCARYLVGWTCGTYAKHNGSKRLQWF